MAYCLFLVFFYFFLSFFYMHLALFFFFFLLFQLLSYFYLSYTHMGDKTTRQDKKDWCVNVSLFSSFSDHVGVNLPLIPFILHTTAKEQ